MFHAPNIRRRRRSGRVVPSPDQSRGTRKLSSLRMPSWGRSRFPLHCASQVRYCFAPAGGSTTPLEVCDRNRPHSQAPYFQLARVREPRGGHPAHRRPPGTPWHSRYRPLGAIFRDAGTPLASSVASDVHSFRHTSSEVGLLIAVDDSSARRSF